MLSTRSGPLCRYLGVDLSSRYSRQPRANDVCGLQVLDNGTLSVHCWQWYWDGVDQELDASPLAEELRAARYVMVDGPHGLARSGHTIRASERLCRAAGKTPDATPPGDQPYAAFIRSSLELFQVLRQTGYAISPPRLSPGIYEYYPGAAWQRLSQTRLPKKTLRAGRQARLQLLQQFGLIWEPQRLPTHDQNDACLGALLGAAAHGASPHLTVEAIGPHTQLDVNGVMREGPIIMPCRVPRLD